MISKILLSLARLSRSTVFMVSCRLDKEIALEDVLLVADGDKVRVGKPNVKGARVTAEVIEPDKKGQKVIAFKFRRREGYHRKRGIRPHHTVLKIKEIVVK